MSLQGLEGNGDREPGACGGMWGRRWEGSLEVGDEEGRDGKLLVLPGEPPLVAVCAYLHWLHLFGFSPLCVFKCVFKLPAREEA